MSTTNRATGAWGRHSATSPSATHVSAGLAEVAGHLPTPPAFNGKLNHPVFGPSWATCDEPRHLVTFRAGRGSGWSIPRSPPTRIRRGRRLCSAQYEYPYGAVHRSQGGLAVHDQGAGAAQRARAEQGGPVSALRAMLARLTRRRRWRDHGQDRPEPAGPQPHPRGRLPQVFEGRRGPERRAHRVVRERRPDPSCPTTGSRPGATCSTRCRSPTSWGRPSSFCIWTASAMASRCARRAWAAARESVAKTPVSQEEFEAAVRQATPTSCLALSDRLFRIYRYAQRLCPVQFRRDGPGPATCISTAPSTRVT